MDKFQSQAPESGKNSGEKQFVMPPKDHTKLWVVVFILVAVAIIAGVYYKGTNKQAFKQEKPKPVVTNKLPEGYKTVALEKDKYPEGFPVDIIFKEGSPVWQRSEDTIDGAGMRHRVVDILYKKAPGEVLSAYTTGLSKAGWIIEQENNSDGFQVVIFLKKGTSASDDQRMAVVLTAQGEGVLVSLQYLTKN